MKPKREAKVEYEKPRRVVKVERYIPKRERYAERDDDDGEDRREKYPRRGGGGSGVGKVLLGAAIVGGAIALGRWGGGGTAATERPERKTGGCIEHPPAYVSASRTNHMFRVHLSSSRAAVSLPPQPMAIAAPTASAPMIAVKAMLMISLARPI